MPNQIRDLREKLNSGFENGELDYEEILKISEELDELIVRFYKESRIYTFYP